MGAPRRTCIGCRRTTETHELVRVVRNPAGSLVVARHAPGRGAWLCAGSPRCIELAERRNAFARSLRGQVSPAAIAALKDDMTGGGSPRAPGPG